MKANLTTQKAKSQCPIFVLIFGFHCLMAVSVFSQTPGDLTEKIRFGSVQEKREALYQIRNLQTVEASRAAILALQDPDEIVRVTATHSVIFLPGDESAQILLPLLQDKSLFVRRETIYALGKTKNSKVVPLLLEILRRDKVLEIRTATALALGEIGDDSALDPFLKLLQKKPKETEAFLRRTVVRSIGQIAQRQQLKEIYTVTPESLLPDRYDVLVNQQYSNLAEISSELRQSVSVLLAVLQNSKESDDVRRESAFALGAIGDFTAIRLLNENLAAKDYYLAEICRESLIKLQKAAEGKR